MKPISRQTDSGVVIYSDDVLPVATVPVPNGTEAHAVPSSRDRIVAITGDEVLCLALDGTPLWRYAVASHDGFPSVDYSPDERLIWVFAPGAPGGGHGDRWFALDAADGDLRHDHRLATAGQGSVVRAVTSDGGMLLEIGEGQDGLPMFRTDGDGGLHKYAFEDRSLADVAPDGLSFMTVDHGQEDVAFHEYPSGRITARYGVTDLGFGDDVYVEWAGGYLDQETAIVVVGGIDEESDEEWWRFVRLDLTTGEAGEMSVATIDPYDLEPLGDGTFLVTDTDETLRRL